MSKQIAVIYNEPKHTLAEDHWLHHSQESVHENPTAFRDASEFGVLEQMQSIAAALRASGHEVTIFSADDDVFRLVQFLEKERPAAIFNCCESIMGKSSLEMNIAALYELFGIPYTGSPALTLAMALDKGLAKSIFIAHGIRTPRHVVFTEPEYAYVAGSLTFPLIVKPIREDASIGIDVNSIVHTEEALRARVEFVWHEFEQPALAEEYIEGRELNIAVIGAASGAIETLPISEISFDEIPEGSPRIVSYEAKWVEESELYKKTMPRCPAVLEPEIESEARAMALASAQAIGLRDYGRVDLRLRDDGALFVLEANPNPDISEDAGFMRAARESGRTYESTINEIVSLALARSVHA